MDLSEEGHRIAVQRHIELLRKNRHALSRIVDCITFCGAHEHRTNRYLHCSAEYFWTWLSTFHFWIASWRTTCQACRLRGTRQKRVKMSCLIACLLSTKKQYVKKYRRPPLLRCKRMRRRTWRISQCVIVHWLLCLLNVTLLKEYQASMTKSSTSSPHKKDAGANLILNELRRDILEMTSIICMAGL